MAPASKSELSTIAERLQAIKSSLPEGVTLVAVSKFHPVEALLEAYAAGQRHFGESRAQELEAKAVAMPPDVVWHFIGHLQRNKVRHVVRIASIIESVDSLELLRLIDREAARVGRRIDVLLELHVAEEETKSGMSLAECDALINSIAREPLSNVAVRGLMGMATFTDDEKRVRADFNTLRMAFDRLKRSAFAKEPSFDTLSMGMSDDYGIAVECGSTAVRIGTAIFGARAY